MLFVPHGVPSLKAILTYYSATASVTHEGDVHVNDPLQGLGISPYFLQIFISSAVLAGVMPAFFVVSQRATFPPLNFLIVPKLILGFEMDPSTP